MKTPTAKRTRKRKRTHISSSSSSSSSLSSSSSPSENEKSPVVLSRPVPTVDASDSDSSDSSSSSSSSTKASQGEKGLETGPFNITRRRQPPSRSPSPPSTTIPPVVSLNPTTDAEKEKDMELKERFRKYWMASVADEFKEDLEEIRKEPNLSATRLSLLIDALASGAEVFSTTSQAGENEINEMEVVLGSS